MLFPRFELLEPRSLAEAANLLNQSGNDIKIMAGGTDLLVKMRQGVLKPKSVMFLGKIDELRKISFDKKEGLTIGATALLSAVASHPEVVRKFPTIAYAAGVTANTQIRNMGTVGGNLCNASPSADNAPTLIAMGAEVNLFSRTCERRLALEEFFRGPGISVMGPEEIMTSIFVPLPAAQTGTSYKHLSARSKVDMPAVSVGTFIRLEQSLCGDVRIALGAVAPTPMRARKAEEVIRRQRLTETLIERASAQAAAECKPISDVRASAEYRRKMVAVLLKRALVEAHEAAQKGRAARGRNRNGGI